MRASLKLFPPRTRQELYLAYSRGASPLGEDLSPDCVTALEEVLLSRPRETALLLGHAAGRLGGECAVARQLWLLHLRALRLCLGELKGSLSRYEEVGQRARTRLFMLLHLVPDPLVALALQDPQARTLCFSKVGSVRPGNSRNIFSRHSQSLFAVKTISYNFLSVYFPETGLPLSTNDLF